jgi:putative ATP-binding cassette transporter
VKLQAFRNSLSFLSKVAALTVPYWRSEERWRAGGLLTAIVGLTLGLVYILVLINEWNREFYTALELRDFESFSRLLLQFSLLAAIYIVASVYKLYLTQMLEINWRAWLTRRYITSWLNERVYYRLELQQQSTDNPDQRIADDLRMFTSGTLGLSLGLLSSVVTLVSFAAILWTISGPLSFAVGETEVTIPGYMLWVALVYALVGSVLTHFVGRRLIGINFQQERLEADFRFNLVRLRENAESVALYGGESAERAGLLGRFDRIRQNWWELMRYTKRLTSFTVGYGQIANIFPILVAAPRYFSGAINLGTLMQISSAFGQVQDSLSWFVSSYGSLANWKASVDRLLTFHYAIEQRKQEAQQGARLVVRADGANTLRADHLELALPNGAPIVPDLDFQIEPGERVLVQGPSGSGKSTLFRAIAGIWPFGRGQLQLPCQARMLFLPQKPYMPIGTLRAAVSYPTASGAFDDQAIREALQAALLAPLADRLDEQQNWSLQLSGGEQQRLAIARALLHRPDWLFLDEATSALDEPTERQLYELIRQRLPEATIVSVAHRPSVASFHDRTLALGPDQDRRGLAAA